MSRQAWVSAEGVALRRAHDAYSQALRGAVLKNPDVLRAVNAHLRSLHLENKSTAQGITEFNNALKTCVKIARQHGAQADQQFNPNLTDLSNPINMANQLNVAGTQANIDMLSQADAAGAASAEADAAATAAAVATSIDEQTTENQQASETASAEASADDEVRSSYGQQGDEAAEEGAKSGPAEKIVEHVAIDTAATSAAMLAIDAIDEDAGADVVDAAKEKVESAFKEFTGKDEKLGDDPFKDFKEDKADLKKDESAAEKDLESPASKPVPRPPPKE